VGDASGEKLTREVQGLEQDSISAIKQLALRAPDPEAGNEVAVLENAFIELSRQIASQWDQLADNDRQRREFVANISHDLRTPLTSLLGYLETLSVKAGHLTPEESKHYLSIACARETKSGTCLNSSLNWRGWNMVASNRSRNPSQWRNFCRMWHRNSI
jgi:signal transduction histidine kinase